ncbi:L-ribulose-5-phosphate 3-epimerase [Staphylococcus lutrae]|uniref:L-ribulose-5-phosphate 3-epimerase n=1 Tax=Staphylococcus lutrae TaxID=155085 RepID=A0AAC9RN01_9STAP|nr:L-ribulose-5-phosphate 3-epimerase [Staphylococcus lutrae]ARJ50076.1 xylulose 5-phosphate 3-epimerase [Staphylococcus lutrae]PNZ38352.1 L-ribulose-5-phosphate 3-epimerase [Staphylococcus lutrae]
MIHLGIYEKALPFDLDVEEQLKLASELGFQFYELSIDETDERIARLDWTMQKIKKIVMAQLDTGVSIQSMCLSAHRRFPFGSADPHLRKQAMDIMRKAILLAHRLGIKVIQLAGYDVYYEDKTEDSRRRFIEGLSEALKLAASKQIILAIEIMDDPFMSSLTKYNVIKDELRHPLLKVYPDIGNLSAWPENNVEDELKCGAHDIVAVHLKDTLAVTETFKGQFKNVPFGKGCVDFIHAFRCLEALQYHGPFLIEMWSEHAESPIKEIKAAKKFIMEQLEKSGAYQHE